ncbi:MAG: PQQ-binding-like beta-propeller repeat protein [Planctomycetales bacterium]|nr:PQQ-binding-like beta-propeller repeat protein [Planctomycetales bacterium]
MIANQRWSTVFLWMGCTVWCASALAAEGDWPKWRGPSGDGHSTEKTAPVRWDDTSIIWRTELPGDGQSSPVIWGDRIYLTTALESGRQRVVLCVDRRSGNIVWQQTVWTGEPEASHGMNGWASATCATDGERVVAFFGRGGLHCLDVEGKKLWSKDLGKFGGPWGTGASPLIVDDLVIQNCEAEDQASVTALNKRTGEVVWQTPRDVPQRGGWSSPVLIASGTRREVVLNGFNGVTSYDPASGKKLWFCKSFAGRGEPTATFGHGLVLMVNGLSGDIYAVRPGGEGDVTETQMAWHTPRKAGRDQPSPIVVGDVMIVVSMDGIGCAYDVVSGRELWKERLGGRFTSSPIAANGLLYIQSDSGETIVIKPGSQLSIVSRNALPTAPSEIFRASLALSRGQMFSRSNKALYCLTSSKGQ